MKPTIVIIGRPTPGHIAKHCKNPIHAAPCGVNSRRPSSSCSLRPQRSATNINNEPATKAKMTAPLANRFSSIQSCRSRPKIAAGKNAITTLTNKRCPAGSRRCEMSNAALYTTNGSRLFGTAPSSAKKKVSGSVIPSRGPSGAPRAQRYSAGKSTSRVSAARN